MLVKLPNGVWIKPVKIWALGTEVLVFSGTGAHDAIRIPCESASEALLLADRLAMRANGQGGGVEQKEGV